MTAVAVDKLNNIVKGMSAKQKAAVKARLDRSYWQENNLRDLWLDDNQKGLVEQLDRARAEKQTDVWWNCCRRMGKSFALCVYAYEYALKNPKADIKYAAPEKEALEYFLLPIMNLIIESCPDDLADEKRARWLGSKSMFVFPNGSRIIMAGVERNKNKLRGQGTDLAVIDEAGFMSSKVLKYLVRSVLGPQVIDKGGVMVAATTPPEEPDHSFIELWKEADSAWTFTRNVYQTPRYTPEKIAAAMKLAGGENSDEWKREYLVQMNTAAIGSVIPNFINKQDQIVKPIDSLPLFFDRYISFDYGHSLDPSACLFGAWDWRRSVLVIQAEKVWDRKTNTKILCDDIDAIQKSIWGEHEPYSQFGDMPGGIRTDMWELHRRSILETRKDDKESAVNEVILFIEDLKVQIDPSCTKLIAQLKNATWAKHHGLVRKMEFARHKDHGHYDLVDCLIYMVRNVDRNHNPTPKDHGYNPQTQFRRPGSEQVGHNPSPGDKLKSFFGRKAVAD